MSKPTLKQILDSMPSHVSDEFERAVDRDAVHASQFEQDLMRFMLDWAREHPDADDYAEPVLMKHVAVRLIATGMTIEDVAEWARTCAVMFEEDGKKLSQAIELVTQVARPRTQ